MAPSSKDYGRINAFGTLISNMAHIDSSFAYFKSGNQITRKYFATKFEFLSWYRNGSMPLYKFPSHFICTQYGKCWHSWCILLKPCFNYIMRLRGVKNLRVNISVNFLRLFLCAAGPCIQLDYETVQERSSQMGVSVFFDKIQYICIIIHILASKSRTALAEDVLLYCTDPSTILGRIHCWRQDSEAMNKAENG